MEGLSSLAFDTTALEAAVDADSAIAEQRRRDDPVPTSESIDVRRQVFKTIVLVAGFGLLATIAVTVAQFIFGGSGMNGVTWIIAALMMIPLAVAEIRSFRARRRELGERWYRLSRFTEANRMTHVISEPAAQHPIARLHHGGPLAVRDKLNAPQRAGLEVGNYYYSKTLGRSPVEHGSGYVSFEIPTGVPAMTLIARPRDVWGQPAAPQPAQRELPADAAFDGQVTVYCEPADDTAVRLHLTPEVREEVQTAARWCDIAVVDRRIYIMARKALPLADPLFWRWVADLGPLVEALGHPDAQTSAISPTPRAAGDGEREALFAASRSGRSFVVGCLVIVLGLAAAAVVTVLS